MESWSVIDRSKLLFKIIFYFYQTHLHLHNSKLELKLLDWFLSDSGDFGMIVLKISCQSWHQVFFNSCFSCSEIPKVVI